MLPSNQSTEFENDNLLYSNGDDYDIEELEVDQLAFQALLEENEKSWIDHEISVKTEKGDVEEIVAEIVQDAPEKYDGKYICRICLRPTTDTKCWKLFDKTNWLFCKELRKKLDYVAGKINYKITLNPVVCEQCTKWICITYDFKKQVQAVEDRIMKKASKGLANSIVDLKCLLEENVNEDCEKDCFQYDEYSNSYQSVESAEDSGNNQSANQTGDDVSKHGSQRTNGSVSLRDVDQNNCDILAEKEQLSTQKSTSRDILQIIPSSLQDECMAAEDITMSEDIVNKSQTVEEPEHGEEVGETTVKDAEINMGQSDEILISAVNDKTTKARERKREYPRSFDLFDEEHNRYFEKYKNGPECKLTMKWASFAKRQPEFGSGSFLCPECGVTFRTKPLYIKHLKEHKGEHLVVCAYCGKLVKQHRLRYHVVVNHQPRNQECKDCGKKFHTSQHLAIHKKTMHAPEDEWHQCQICGKLLRKNSIKGHVETHSPKIYTCDICGMTFKARNYWVRHKKRHTSTSGVPCPYCGKPFKCRAYLLQHVKQVHEQTDYNCAACGKRLSNRDALRRHLKNVHAPNRKAKRSKRKSPDEREDESGPSTSSNVNKVKVSKVRIIKQEKHVIVYNEVSDDETENSTIILREK